MVEHDMALVKPRVPDRVIALNYVGAGDGIAGEVQVIPTCCRLSRAWV